MLQQRKGFSGLRNNTDKGRVMNRNVFFSKRTNAKITDLHMMKSSYLSLNCGMVVKPKGNNVGKTHQKLQLFNEILTLQRSEKNIAH